MKKRVACPDFISNNKFVKSKHAQITIFIILGILIVALIILFFFVLKPGFISSSERDNPQVYMEECAKEATEKAIEIMLPQGGYISPSNYKLFLDDKVGYLCYTKQYYVTCVNQEPMYIEHLENEIKNNIEGRIKECFSSVKSDLEKRNYNIEEGELNLTIELNPGRAEVIMNKKFNLEKNNQESKYEEFKARVNSPLYDLAIIAQEIASQEAEYCNFEYLGYNMIYTDTEVEKYVTGDSIKIYTITDKKSKQALRIAIRSCSRSAAF